MFAGQEPQKCVSVSQSFSGITNGSTYVVVTATIPRSSPPTYVLRPDFGTVWEDSIKVRVCSMPWYI